MFYLIPNYDSAAEKHAEFLRARGRHYSNEAEAMKVRSFSRIVDQIVDSICIPSVLRS